MKCKYASLSVILVCTIVGLPVSLAGNKDEIRQTAQGAYRLPIEGEFPSLGGALQWLNSPPLAPSSLRGKVVLIDFWTYTCINWRRTLPFVRAWADKYKDQGLVVIGVHSPEFDFERNIDNVRHATSVLTINYPIAIDSDLAIWRSFKNDYWPALYFIDAQGHIRHHQFGEGNYEESERVIQQLLIEAGTGDVSRDLVSVDARGVEKPADVGSLKSPETYLGYERASNFVSRDGTIDDKPHSYVLPSRLRLNHWALSGDWTIGRKAILLNRPGGRIVYRFHARDSHLILASATGSHPVRFRVLIDGKPPGSDHGLDVDEQGNGIVVEPRLYQLIRQSAPVLDAQVEIEFLDPGVNAFSFTFG